MEHDGTDSRFLIRRWATGESALPAVEALLREGDRDQAAVLARAALAAEDCLDRNQLEEALYTIASPPDGWMEGLVEFARNPGEEKWDELMAFVPPEVFYQRLRNTTSILSGLGCDHDVLFRCVARGGMTSDLFDLARSGKVSPETIEYRGRDSGARSGWLGLAALAAFARGDRFNTVRYMEEACANEETAVLAWAAISELRRDADAQLNEELTRAGIPE